MISADIKGGLEAARTVLNNVKIFSLATSLGNVDSLVQHSPSMSHFDMTKKEREAVEIYKIAENTRDFSRVDESASVVASL
jgi:methionine-gamma-lyase